MSRVKKMFDLLNIKPPETIRKNSLSENNTCANIVVNEAEANKLQLEKQTDVLNKALENEILFVGDDGIIHFGHNDDAILETSVQSIENIETEDEQEMEDTKTIETKEGRDTEDDKDYEPSHQSDDDAKSQEHEEESNTQENVGGNQGHTESMEVNVVGKGKKRKLPIVKRDKTYKGNKRKRELGMAYSGKKKNEGKWNYVIQKPKKFLLNPCSCKFSKKYNSLECQKLDENMRRSVFDLFWEKSWPEKREYVRGHTQVESVKRRRGEKDKSRRNLSVKYCMCCDTSASMWTVV